MPNFTISGHLTEKKLIFNFPNVEKYKFLVKQYQGPLLPLLVIPQLAVDILDQKLSKRHKCGKITKNIY